MSRLTCTDCIHDYVCHNLNNLNYWNKDDPNGDPMDKFCLCFKNKELFIELPCKLGDTVYYIDDGEIYYDKASSIEISKEEGKYIFGIAFMDWKAEDFGKKVFLSEAEAYRAELKEGEQ